MVNCKICNKKFKRITATHLKQHNTTVAKYVKQYGKEELFDDYLRVLYDTASKKSFIGHFISYLYNNYTVMIYIINQELLLKSYV